MKRILLICILVVLASASVYAQDATPEVTPEATAEILQNLSEVFAGLPYERLADGAFVIGQPDAPITVIEFADFACPHCQNYRPVIDQMIRDYVVTGIARFELRIYPTAGGELTYRVGQLLECADNLAPGAFWQSYELMYGIATVGGYSQNVAKVLADEFDISHPQLTACADKAAKQIDKDIAYAELHGVTGTPAVMVREGAGAARFITAGGREYSAGGVPLEVLATVIENANGGPQTVV